MSTSSRPARTLDPRVVGVAAAVPRTHAYLRSHPGTARGTRVGLGAQVLLDEVMLAALRNPALLPHERDVEIAGAEAEAAHALFEKRGWLDDPASYHQEPMVPVPQVRMRKTGRRHHDVLTFPVTHQPHDGEPGVDRWLGYPHHRTARASVLRHREAGRPWLVCVHGFSMGDPAMDLRVFRASRLHDELGVNLLLPVLPSHGDRRGTGMRTGEGFTSVNVVDGIHGVAQAVWEIRSLVAWIREQDPGAPIGVHGISLGGLVAGLLASLEPGLACAIASIPVADLFALYRRNSSPETLAVSDRTGATGPTAEAIGRVVSPLALRPLVDRKDRYIVAGLGDRMSTTAQAERLWEHWDRPAVHWYPGGHVGYFLARTAAAAVEDAVQRSLLSRA